MKDLKEKIKKLIASGEDPELVRKLEEVLKDSEDTSPAEEEPASEPEELIAIPSEVSLPPEAFDRLRSIAAERTKIESALGQYYIRFENQMKQVVAEVQKRITAASEEQKNIVEKYAPEGHSEEYILATAPGEEEGSQKIILKRRQEEPEEE